MLSFDRENRRFEYRVSGLCIHDGYVLLTRADQDDYWILPGGRIEIPEDTRATPRRELLEETGHAAEIKTLLRIVENFFDLAGPVYHEPAFIYTISPTDPTVPYNTWTHQTTDGDVQIELRCFELKDIERVNAQPAFLKLLLQNPPQTPHHMIVRQPHQRQAHS